MSQVVDDSGAVMADFLSNNNQGSHPPSSSSNTRKHQQGEQLYPAQLQIQLSVNTEQPTSSYCSHNTSASEAKTDSNSNTGSKRWSGICFALVASMFFSMAMVILKYVKDYDPMSAVAFRFAGTLVILLPMILYYNCRKHTSARVFETVWPLTKPENRSQLVRLMACGFLEGAAVIFQISAFKYITVADSAAISHASPICVIILAHFLLQEKCSWISVLMSLVTCVGVFIIAKPPQFTGAASFDTNALIGIALALLSMVANAAVVIVLRDVRKAHYTLVNISLTFGGATEALIASLATGTFTLPQEIQAIVLVVLVEPLLIFVAHLALSGALKYENAGPVALVITTDAIFSFCWQYLLLGVVPDACSAIGSTLVVTGVLLTGLGSWLAHFPANHSMRRRFNWIL